MVSNNLSEYIQNSAREASILENFSYVIHSLSDYLYFCTFFSEFLSSKFSILSKYKKISSQELSIFQNAYARVTNALLTWISEQTYKGGFKSNKGLSSGLISRFDVKRKKALKDFLNEVDDKLDVKYKVEFANVVIRSLINAKYDKLLSLKGIAEQSIPDLTIGYTSSIGFSYPALMDTLSTTVKDKIIALKGTLYKTNYSIKDKDKEIMAGHKKPVVIDIQAAVLNSYIRYASTLLQAFKENNVDQIENAILTLQNIHFFFTNSQDIALPSTDIITFDKSINLHSIIQAVKVGEATGHKYIVIMSLSGDIEARKFFIKFPLDYSFFSGILSLIRSKEYESAPGNFVIQHESEIANSNRINSANSIIAEIADWQREAIVSKNVRHFLVQAQKPFKHIPKSATIGAIAYVVANSIDPEASLTTGITTGIVEYIHNILKSGSQKS